MNKDIYPKVSICVVTYNQKDYVSECIQSLLDQETDFPFEIIISDDASNDGTAKIIQNFAIQFPNTIQAVLHKVNIGALNNYWFVHSLAKGAYIAHMDGDDIALHGKLQEQANILDNDLNCNIVFHRVYESGSKLTKLRYREPVIACRLNKKYYRKDLIALGAIATNSSKMYRSTSAESHINHQFIDQTMQAIQVGSGYARFCGEKAYGCYRKGIGISVTHKKTIADAHFNGLNFLLENYPEEKAAIAASALFETVASLLNFRFEKKALSLFFKTFTPKSMPLIINKVWYEMLYKWHRIRNNISDCRGR